MKKLLIQGWDLVAGKNEKLLDACSVWIFPLTFAFSNLLNLAFYYLGLAFEENAARQYGFIIGCVLFACVCGWAFFHVIKRNSMPAVRWILLSLVVLFFGGSFAMGLLTDSSRSVMFEYAKQFVFFAAPAFLAGIVAAVKRTEANFFCALEKLSFFALPAVVIYMNGVLFDCNPFNWGRDLGILSYMTLAYTLMPLFLALLVRFADGEKLPIPFTKRYFKRSQLVRGIMIAVYWVALIATATRGMYVCVAVFCVLLVISRWIRKEPAKNAWWVSFAMAAVLLFTMFIYAPPGMYAVTRATDFIEKLLQGQFVTSGGEREDIDDLLDDMILHEGGQQIANRPGESTNPSTEPSTAPPTEPSTAPPTEPSTAPPTEPSTAPPTEPSTAPPTEPSTAPPTEPSTAPPTEPPTEPSTAPPTEPSTEPTQPTESGIDIMEENVQIGNRGTMFKLALGEFAKSPVTGMGPGGYKVKYGTYPHNIILEMLCETGLLGSMTLFLLVILAIVKLGIIGWKNKNDWYIMVFLLTYAVQANISGSLWNCPALLCALGYGLAMPMPKLEKKLKPKQ